MHQNFADSLKIKDYSRLRPKGHDSILMHSPNTDQVGYPLLVKAQPLCSKFCYHKICFAFAVGFSFAPKMASIFGEPHAKM